MKTVLHLAWAALLTALPAIAQAQTSIYVNDAAITGDIYTTAPGSDATGNGSAAAPFATVARALADAPVGSTIFIDAGIYREAMVLNKPVNLQGAGDSLSSPGSATIFRDGLRTADNVYNGLPALQLATTGSAAQPLRISRMSLRRYDVGIAGAAAPGSLSHITFEDLDIFKCYRQGIELAGNVNDLTFRRVGIRLTRIQGVPTVEGNNYGRGLFFNGTDAGAEKRNLLIENCAFEQNRRAGIDVNERAVANIVVRSCRFVNNVGPALALLKAGGMRSSDGNFISLAALIEDNILTDNGSNGFELKSCTGTGLSSGPGSFVVRNNRITRDLSQSTAIVDDNAGIAFIDRDREIDGRPSMNDLLVTGGAWIENNFIEGYRSSTSNRNAFGIVLEGSNNQVRHNVVTRCQIGIQVQDRPATTSTLLPTPFFDITRNQFLASENVVIQQNRVDACDLASLRGVNLRNVVNASLNWLGSNSVTAIRGNNGTGGLIRTLARTSAFTFPEESSLAPTGRFDYSPFLNSDADMSTAVGFQPDMSFLNVTPNSPLAGTDGHLQEAFNMVTDGGTVKAITGTFDETATLTKNLTLTQDTGPVTIRGLAMNGAGKTLQLAAPFTISGTLTLTAGIINTTAQNLLTLADDATSTAGNAGSYVAGPLRKVGNEAFVFPLGRDGVWARIGISAPNTASSAFTAEYAARAFGAQPVQAPLTNASRVEHWTLERTAGSAGVAVRLFWEDGGRSGIVDLAQLRVARIAGSNWVDEGNGGTTGTAANGSVVSAGNVNGFGVFSFGSLNLINPLPVELTAFRAEVAGEGRARLHWTTAQEKNNRGFEIERALNGNEWQRVGFVAGAGNSTGVRQYSFLDVSGLTDMVFYRLRQIDHDGKASYSPVAAVRLPAVRGTLAVFPNPANVTDEVAVRLATPATGPVTVQLIDAVGRVVWTTKATANGQSLTVPLKGHVQTGMYLLRVSSKGLPPEAQQLMVR